MGTKTRYNFYQVLVFYLTYWKFSANDKKSLSAFDKVTLHKEDMFDHCPKWHSIDYNNKEQGRDDALQVLVNQLERI